MRIAVLDISGGGLGLGLGLVQLGHEVRYLGPEAWPGDPQGELDEQRRQLIEHHFAGEARCDDGDELLVVYGSFADELRAMHLQLYFDQRYCPEAPLRPTLNPLVYPARLQLALTWASAAPRVVVVDGSDARALREPVFEQLPNTTLLAREVGRTEQTAWRPFPFLYNPVLLWLETLRPEQEWLVPAERRAPQWDWGFCGTVDHPRYGDRRRRGIAEVQQCWPGGRGVVATTASFGDVLRVLQSVRCGLDLPGAGEICFRLHEYLALGVPVLRPSPFGVVLPVGVHRAIVAGPEQLAGLDVDAVRAIYRARYAPRAAAATLLAVAARMSPWDPVPASGP